MIIFLFIQARDEFHAYYFIVVKSYLCYLRMWYVLNSYIMICLQLPGCAY